MFDTLFTRQGTVGKLCESCSSLLYLPTSVVNRGGGSAVNFTMPHFLRKDYHLARNITNVIFQFSKDKCQEYFEALMVDPLLEVTPTMALAETFTAFVVQPLEHLGRHIGKFFNALLHETSYENDKVEQFWCGCEENERQVPNQVLGGLKVLF